MAGYKYRFSPGEAYGKEDVEFPIFTEHQAVRFGLDHKVAYVDTTDVDGDTTRMRLRLPGESRTFIIWKGLVWAVGE